METFSVILYASLINTLTKQLIGLHVLTVMNLVKHAIHRLVNAYHVKLLAESIDRLDLEWFQLHQVQMPVNAKW